MTKSKRKSNQKVHIYTIKCEDLGHDLNQEKFESILVSLKLDEFLKRNHICIGRYYGHGETCLRVNMGFRDYNEKRKFDYLLNKLEYDYKCDIKNITPEYVFYMRAFEISYDVRHELKDDVQGRNYIFHGIHQTLGLSYHEEMLTAFVIFYCNYRRLRGFQAIWSIFKNWFHQAIINWRNWRE